MPLTQQDVAPVAIEEHLDVPRGAVETGPDHLARHPLIVERQGWLDTERLDTERLDRMRERMRQ